MRLSSPLASFACLRTRIIATCHASAAPFFSSWIRAGEPPTAAAAAVSEFCRILLPDEVQAPSSTGALPHLSFAPVRTRLTAHRGVTLACLPPSTFAHFPPLCVCRAVFPFSLFLYTSCDSCQCSFPSALPQSRLIAVILSCNLRWPLPLYLVPTLTSAYSSVLLVIPYCLRPLCTVRVFHLIPAGAPAVIQKFWGGANAGLPCPANPFPRSCPSRPL
jgi:hypothetical protein